MSFGVQTLAAARDAGAGKYPCSSNIERANLSSSHPPGKKESCELADLMEIAHRVSDKLGRSAQIQSKLGVLGPFGQWLGWPDWFFEGTSVDPSDGIPATTSIVDALIIHGNIIRRGYAGQLVDETLNAKRLITGPDAALIVRNAPTLGEAIKNVAALLSFTNQCFNIRRAHSGDTSIVEVVELIPVGRILDLYAAVRLILFLRTIERFFVEDIGECTVQLTLRRENAGKALLSSSGPKFELSAPSNQIIYPARWEFRKNADYDPSLWELALFDLQALEKHIVEGRFPHRLRSQVKSMIERDQRVPRLKEIAALENASVRTINRRLSEENIRYQDIVDEVRRSQVSRLILHGTMSLSEIARRTGYSNASSFSRAFREWFGESPTSYRHRLQRGE